MSDTDADQTEDVRERVEEIDGEQDAALNTDDEDDSVLTLG